ncbi:uncharacterized protein LOC124413621 [Diprion similis]|uniref:uncharacterized protein LOC124413621 n=1 Tax=Diprion similis TaxID=362088 RepID=UPI001EF98DDB|nr:uncharacterized protein LOC124413621 [Diprion similis]
MRFKLLKLATVLLLAGSSDGRPQKLEVSRSLQPEVEDPNTEGWRPVQRGVNFAQEPKPVVKDLPQIVEGNSRYTEGRRATRGKAYLMNNLFYEDRIVLEDKRVGDRNYEQLDLGASDSELFRLSVPRTKIGLELGRNLATEGRSSKDVRIPSGNEVGRIKGRNTFDHFVANKTAEAKPKLVDEVSMDVKSHSNLDKTVLLLGNNLSSNTDESTDRIISLRRSRDGSLAIGSVLSSSRMTLEKPEAKVVSSSRTKPRVVIYSGTISEGSRPAQLNRAKVRNFLKIVPTYANQKISRNKPAHLHNNLHSHRNIHNRVSSPNLHDSQAEVKHFESDSKKSVVTFHLLTDQSVQQKFGQNNSTNNLIRMKPQANQSLPHFTLKSENHQAGEQVRGKNKPKSNVKVNVNSSQSVSDLNLKNWPNDNLQNIEDLYNYEKYTSFDDGYDSLEAQEITDVSVLHQNAPSFHVVKKKPGSKPSISEADMTAIPEPASYANLEQSAQEVVQWQQIPPFTSDNSDFLATEMNGNESNTFDPIPEGLEPNQPINLEQVNGQSTNFYGYINGKPSVPVMQNYDDSAQGQVNYEDQYHQLIFQNLNSHASQNNFYPTHVTRPTSETVGSDGAYMDYQTDPTNGPNLSKKPQFNPTSVVSQNTVVHILNTGKKRPNVTVTEMKEPDNPGTSLNPNDPKDDKKNDSASAPNVHIMFTMQKDEIEQNEMQPGVSMDHEIPEVTYDEGSNCPTVTINSYTRINNTVQGKEGCTDLNIVINSHVLNTNVFKHPPPSTGNYGSATKVPSERYPGSGLNQGSYAPPSGGYGTSGGGYGTFPSGSGQHPEGLYQQGDSQNVPIDDGQDLQGVLQYDQYDQQFPGTATLEVFQQTQINVGSQNDVSDAEGSFEPDPPGNSPSSGDGLADDPSAPDAGVPDSPLNPGAAPGSLPGFADDPGGSEVASDPAAGGGVPSIPSLGGMQGFPPLGDEEIPADVAAAAVPENAAADVPISPGTGGSSGIQLPGIGNPLSGITGQLSDAVGNLGSQNGNGGLGPGSVLGDDDDVDDDDDEDDDDELMDLMPFSIVESMTSMLPYFTFLNPLNYGFFSIAMSPLAVAAAGIFGLAAFFVPFAFPTALGFGRATNRVKVRVTPTLEDMVIRSIHKYNNWNEWKSRRKKRKRIQVSKSQRDAKDLPDMKQSLRTVATQLLNVTDPNESPKTSADLKNEAGRTSEPKKLVTIGKIGKFENLPSTEVKSKTEDPDLLIKEINSEISSMEAIGVSFGRPMNSKFGYFESSHPGLAMAVTDEELEKELSSRRDVIGYKNQLTTPGGISTWILLNPPTTTPKSVQQEAKKPADTVKKIATKPTSSIEKIDVDQQGQKKPIAIVEKVMPTQSSGKLATNKVKPVPSNSRNGQKTTTVKPQVAQTTPKKATVNPGQSPAEVTTPKTKETDNFPTTEKVLTVTKKIIQVQRTTQQKLATSTTTVRSTPKIPKGNLNRTRFPARTTTTAKPEKKPETVSTTMIEKVTFKPVQMIPTPKDETIIERPTFVAKIKTPIPVEMPRSTPAPVPKSTTPEFRETTMAAKTDFTGSDLVEVPVQTKLPITKINNVLKAEMKKPIDEAPKIEDPVLKSKKQSADEKVDALSDKAISQALNNSQIDLKFEFNPELTKIEVKSPPEEPLLSTTTKKPRRSSQKRRRNKNKVKRRRPSSSTTESSEVTTELIASETALQESKVEPDTKEVNATKTKKKQVEKPIGTQIYNYLSREIMPSFGVVSLVGLGLGLASYFLYPFGGGIARRNYEVEPNYKYNLGEYGGNYGQSEEEVFSKVLQGMTNHEEKYGGAKDYDLNNYYRYQKFGGPAITDTKLTKRIDHRYPTSSSGTAYKPLENSYDMKYKNTEFKYPEVSTTANYFERQKQSGYTVSADGDADRQFVVGSVPKEYGYVESPVVGQKTSTYGENGDGQTQFEEDGAQNYAFPKNSANVSPLQSYGQPEALPLKSDANYDEIEITPTAVAVEHGPRALKVKRSIDEDPFRAHPRFRRESVIQVIPPSGSLAVTEKEENLSNEIFDILDLMIPGKDEARKIKDHTMSNSIDHDEKIEKKREGEKTNMADSTTENIVELEDKKTSEKLVAPTVIPTMSPTETSSSTHSPSTTAAQEVEVVTTTPTAFSEEAPTESQTKDESIDDIATETEGQDLEETTVESLDEATTTEKADKPEESGFNIFEFVRKVAEIKFRLGLTILKHASEGFARYLGGVQKRINGEE